MSDNYSILVREMIYSNIPSDLFLIRIQKINNEINIQIIYHVIPYLENVEYQYNFNN